MRNKEPQLNVFGQDLITCSKEPLTGYFRDGCCNTGPMDIGTHTVCAIMTHEFLDFSKSKGNDLITPLPHYQFPGLKPGDKWCLCVNRWKEAYEAGVAPIVVLEATHQKALDYVTMSQLTEYALRNK